MRALHFLLIAISFFACASGKMSSPDLNGSWKPVHQEIGGTRLPEAVVTSQQLIIADTNYTVIAESVDKGSMKFNGDKIDIYSKEGVNAGKHFTAIYKLKNDSLTVCYNLAGDGYPAEFTTAGQPLYFLSVFTRMNSK